MDIRDIINYKALNKILKENKINKMRIKHLKKANKEYVLIINAYSQIFEDLLNDSRIDKEIKNEINNKYWSI